MAKVKNNELPGDSMGSAALMQRIWMKSGRCLYEMDMLLQKREEDGFYIKALRFANKGTVRGEWLCVVTATDGSSHFVAFHAGSCFQEVLEGVVARIKNGSLKWKEDEYANS